MTFAALFFTGADQVPTAFCLDKTKAKCIFDKMLWPPKVHRSLNLTNLICLFFELCPLEGYSGHLPKKIFPIAGLCLSLHEISKPFGAKGKGTSTAIGFLTLKNRNSALAWVQYPKSFFPLKQCLICPTLQLA
jgi:hypothetical protein